jgi:hypothetical protein
MHMQHNLDTSLGGLNFPVFTPQCKAAVFHPRLCSQLNNNQKHHQCCLHRHDVASGPLANPLHAQPARRQLQQAYIALRPKLPLQVLSRMCSLTCTSSILLTAAAVFVKGRLVSLQQVIAHQEEATPKPASTGHTAQLVWACGCC